MMDQRCGCEEDRRCTFLSLCEVQNLMSDQEAIQEDLTTLLWKAQKILGHRRSGQDSNELAGEIQEFLEGLP